VTLSLRRSVSSEFSVVALIAGYNEADIIGHVVGNLIDQGVGVYFLDDGSTDGTVDIVSQHLGRGVLAIEDLSKTFNEFQAGSFKWEQILQRKAQLASQLDADWVMHHDADEFRESPWPHTSLLEGIRGVEALGFNAIDFQCLDFWPVHDRFRPGDDVREAFSFYAPAAAHDRLQIKCWKKTGTSVDLTASGGHEARFPGRKVFPVRFLLRHYPIRGQAHGERKVFEERRARFVESERARGWHLQYDDVHEGQSFIRDPSTLTQYKPEEVRIALAIRHRGVEELDEAVSDLRAEGDTLRVDLSQCKADLAQERAVLKLSRAELASTRGELEAVRGTLHAANQEAERFRATVDQLGAELGVARGEIAGLKLSVAESVRRIEELKNSKSWRWTAPARAMIDFLRGGF
jgi:hypothetical protein